MTLFILYRLFCLNYESKKLIGLNSCFLDLENPIQLFNEWMEEAKKD